MRPVARPGWPLALALVLAASCERRDEPVAPYAAPTARAWFEEVGQASGIDFVHLRAREVRHWFPEIMGGGGGWLDYDGDGDLDLYLVQGGDLEHGPEEGAANVLYRNDGAPGFRDVTAAAGVGDEGYGMGVAAGDYDGDGDTDLYVTNVGPNALYRNDGDGTFTDVTAAAGVGHPGWGSSAAFVDTDEDGDLDLFVVNYINWSPDSEIECYGGGAARDYCHPLRYDAPAATVLYRNDGSGRFTDVTREAGLLAAFGNGLGVAVGDFDGDRRTDLYVANDGMPNQLWINQGDGTFTDRALLAGCAVSGTGMSQAGMGVVAGDADQDGDLDLFMTHLRDEYNTLYLNRDGTFEDASALAGLAAPSLPFTGFGTALADFDHDGLLDAYVVNGRVGGAQVPLTAGDPYAEPNLLFPGTAPGRFADPRGSDGTASPLIENSRAAAFGDYDGDGDVDVAVVNNGGRARLLRNIAGDRTGDGWLAVQALSVAGADAAGAEVRIDRGGRSFRRTAQPAYGYCATNDARAQFGLGEAAGAIERLEISWPGGPRRRFLAVPAGRILRVAHPQNSSRR